MKNQVTIRIAACAAVVIATCAALPLGATELSHRWSFNGDFADSVGGVDAVRCGTYVSLYGGKVHLGYGNCNWGTGCVDLGTNMLDTAAATLEIWARHDGVKSWSRIFDYGADNTHYFALCWTYGTNLNKDRAGAKNSGETATDGTMSPYEIGTEYYIAVTFEQQGEATLVKWQRRDAVTGELQKSGTMTMPDGIQKIVDPVLYLGHSQYTSDRDALAAYDEVRAWRGVLTDDQLAASAAAGPDATITSDVGGPRFVAPEDGTKPVPPERPDGLIKLMTYNIRYCYDETGTINPDHTAARIIAEAPDFCCINEVRDTEAHPEAMLLSKLTGMHKSFGGNLLLSKEEPLSSETITLNMSTEGWGTRYCLICEFTNFCVAVTHLDTKRDSTRDNSLVQASNAVAFATMASAFATYTKPVFLCGDWNTRPNWDNMAVANRFLEILSPTNGVRTYHGNGSSSQILDYISVTKDDAADFIVSDAYVVEDRKTSDHAPVCIEFYRKAKGGEVAEWVNERMTTAGLTGTWSMPVAYDTRTRKAEIEDATFTPTAPSNGRRVTMTVTAEMSAANEEQADPDSAAQAAIRLGTNGCFQVWTRELLGGRVSELGWVDVQADDITPISGTEYTLRMTFDYKTQTYSVEVKSADEWQPLKLTTYNSQFTTSSSFPLATRVTAFSRVKFTGETTFASLLGEYENTKFLGFRVFLR